MEIRPALLYRWRRELETKAETSFLGQGKVIYAPKQAEIHRLKKELLDMQQERDLLKKAVGIFFRSDGKSFGSQKLIGKYLVAGRCVRCSMLAEVVFVYGPTAVCLCDIMKIRNLPVKY